jgi:cell division protein FtsN
MLLIILWFSTIFNTCNKKNDARQNDDMNTALQDTTEVYQDLEDDLFENDQSLFSEEESGTSGTTGSDQPGTTTTTDLFEEEPETYTDYTGAPEQSTESPVPRSGQVDSNPYLVVAGSFLVKENAVKMQNRLIGLGYSAEVRNFNYSQYHSVIAGRYSDQSKADRVVSALRNQGIQCYVHKRKD